jgi:hypothetical protein
MKRCDYCKTKLTVVRSTKKYCSERCKKAFQRLSVTEQQIVRGTKLNRKDWCNEHNEWLSVCGGFKHGGRNDLVRR